MIVEATQFYVVMPLQSYQKPLATFPLRPEAYELKLHKYLINIGT